MPEEKMEYSHYNPNDVDKIERLFIRTFTDSEGQSEGETVGGLAGELMRGTGEADLYGFIVRDSAELVGSILFSRIWFEREINSFILAPVATHTDYQRQGVGKELIKFGLNVLKEDGVELVLTYGDPRFYTKVGFHVVTEAQVPPPFKLSQPEGWMAQPLVADRIGPIDGKSCCVEALNKPEYW